MGQGFRIGNIAGIRVSANWSLLLVLWLIGWALASERYPLEAPGYEPNEYWAAGLVTAAVLYGTVLVHELSHAVVGRREGVQVDGITLWLFGGVTRIRGETPSAGAEFRIAGVGPLVSVAVAAVFAAGAFALDAVGGPALVVAMAAWLARINLILAGFNLIPAAPLDGGRILRSFLWTRHGDSRRAAVTAARAGRLFGFGLVAMGLVDLVAAGGGGGLWFVLVGWFLMMAARGEDIDARVRGALDGVTVRDAMTANPVLAPGWLTLDAFLEEYSVWQRFSALPVEGFDGTLRGLVTLTHLETVPPAERGTVRVQDVAWPMEELATARPDEPLMPVLRRMKGRTGGHVLVLDGGRLVGIVTPSGMVGAVERAAQSDPGRGS